MAHVREVGPYFQSQLRKLESLPIVREVRGLGLMACVELARPGSEDAAADTAVAERVNDHCQQLGLILRPSGNLCVMSPPLIITKAEVDLLVERLRGGIERTQDDLRNGDL